MRQNSLKTAHTNLLAQKVLRYQKMPAYHDSCRRLERLTKPARRG